MAPFLRNWPARPNHEVRSPPRHLSAHLCSNHGVLCRKLGKDLPSKKMLSSLRRGYNTRFRRDNRKKKTCPRSSKIAFLGSIFPEGFHVKLPGSLFQHLPVSDRCLCSRGFEEQPGPVICSFQGKGTKSFHDFFMSCHEFFMSFLMW